MTTARTTPIGKEDVTAIAGSNAFERLVHFLNLSMYEWHHEQDLCCAADISVAYFRELLKRLYRQNHAEPGPGIQGAPLLRRRVMVPHMRVRGQYTPRGIMGSVQNMALDSEDIVVAQVLWDNGQVGLCEANTLREVFDGYDNKYDWYADIDMARDALKSSSVRNNQRVEIRYIGGHGFMVNASAIAEPDHTTMIEAYVQHEGSWKKTS